MVFQIYVFAMYFLCFFLLFIKIGLDWELRIINHLCLIVHAFRQFVRLNYLSLNFLILLSEDTLFLNLLVAKLHLKTCDSAFVRHMILNDGLFHRVIWNVDLILCLHQSAWRGMCLRKLISPGSWIMVAWTYVTIVVLVHGIYIASGCAHGWMPKSWHTTLLAQRPSTDHPWFLDWRLFLWPVIDHYVSLILPGHLFFIIFKVWFVLGKWLDPRCWKHVTLIYGFNTLRHNFNILSSLRAQETALVLLKNHAVIWHLLDRVFLNNIVFFSVILRVGYLQKLSRNIKWWLIVYTLLSLF